VACRDSVVPYEGVGAVSMSDLVLYDARAPVAHITLNRPDKLNALSVRLLDELEAALRRAVADDAVKVIVLTGAGRAFSAGYDLTEEAADQPPTAEEWHTVLARDVEVTMELWRCPKPTIAAVRGWCLAGGCEVAMACDMIVAAEDARFGEPEIRYGSGPVTLLMPFLIGQKKTNELLFTGDVVDAAEAHRIGLVNRVVPAHELEDAVASLVAKIAPTPAAVLRLTKLALLRAYEAAGLPEAVAANLDISAILNAAETPEQREFDAIVARDGLKAALEWRDSRYGKFAP
jgi:enoyl-CoA hydratase